MTSHNENLTAATGMASRLCRRAGRRIVQGRRHGRTRAAFETQRQLPASLRDFGRVWGGANQGLKPLALFLRPSGPETPATLQVQGPPTGRPRRGKSDDRPPDATFQPSDRGGAGQATVQEGGGRRAGGSVPRRRRAELCFRPGRVCRNMSQGLQPWLAPPPPPIEVPEGRRGKSRGWDHGTPALKRRANQILAPSGGALWGALQDALWRRAQIASPRACGGVRASLPQEPWKSPPLWRILSPREVPHKR